MNFLQKINTVWQGVSLVQRALLITIVLTFVIAGGLLTRWASRPDMAVLYSQLDPEEAAKITEKLSEKTIPYQLQNGGTTIYVPRQQIAQMRLDMAKEGLPSNSQQGYGIFDNEKIGVPPFTQKVNLNRAIQDEIAKSIQMIDGVSYARIHIVSADQGIFSATKEQTTASVVLKLRAGYRLAPATIAAVTHLVAGGVKGMEAENVTVIDSQGRLLSYKTDEMENNGASSVADYKERVEHNLAQKVEDLLAAVLGQGRTSVKVSAVIDMNSISTVTETPLKGIAKKEEIKSFSESKPIASAKNDGTTDLPTATKKEETITTDMAVGKSVTQEVILPGKIKSISVAALVDLYSDDPNQTEPIMAIADVEEIILKTIGPRLGKNDLKVVNIKFNRPAKLLISDEEGGGLDLAAIAGQASMGIMAVCALVVLKMFSGPKQKGKKKKATKELTTETDATALLEAETQKTSTGQVRKQIASALANDPEQVKELFASWLEERS